MNKVHLTYAQFQAMRAAQQTTGTVYALIDRYIAEMNGTNGQRPVKPLGESHRCILSAIQRRPIAAKLAKDLTRLIRMQPRIDPNDPEETVFKFNAHSASAAYTAARHRLGITGLRFHDSRRRAITTWLARLKSPHKVKQISGHDTTHILERVYDASDGIGLHADVAKLAAEVR